MAIRDEAAMNASLDNDYGTTRGPNSPAAHELALFMGDPMTDGVEVTATNDDGQATGYARATIAAADWQPAANGEKSAGAVTFPAATAAYPSSVTHFALIAGGVTWDCAPLAEELVVTGAGPGPVVQVTLFHADVLDPDEED